MLTSLKSHSHPLPCAFLGLSDTYPPALQLRSLPSDPDLCTQLLPEDVHLIVPQVLDFEHVQNLLLSIEARSSSSPHLCRVIIFHFDSQARNRGIILGLFLLSSTYPSEAPGATFFHPHCVLTLVPPNF